MVLGHYAVALIAKRAAPNTSLGAMFFAAQFLDELWPVLLLAGVEQVRIVPGLMAALPMEFTHYPYSHSLAMVIVWSVLVAFAYFLIRRYQRGAMVMGALVLSHWLLDAPMHAPDLPLWPGSATMIGAGLWRSLHITLAIEFGLLALGVFVYTRGTRAADRIGQWGFAALIVALSFGYIGWLVMPPPSVTLLAVGSLSLLMFVPWAHVVDKHRTPRESGP